jgi:hypothetical protein
MGQQREGETLVLQDHVDHKNFVGVAQKHLGLIPFETFPLSEDNEIFEDVWINPERTSAVHFIDDPTMGCRHLWVRGTETPQLMSKIYGLLPYLLLEDLTSDLAEADNHHEAVAAMLKIGVNCPTFNPTAFKAFELGLKDSRTSVRNAAIQAIAYSFWPESRLLLEKAIQTESVVKVRDYAQSVLEKYQTQTS